MSGVVSVTPWNLLNLSAAAGTTACGARDSLRDSSTPCWIANSPQQSQQQPEYSGFAVVSPDPVRRSCLLGDVPLRGIRGLPRKFRLGTRAKFLIARVIGYWNKLPRGAEHSLGAFKAWFIAVEPSLSGNCWAAGWNLGVKFMGLGQGDQHGQGGCLTPPDAVKGQSSQCPVSTQILWGARGPTASVLCLILCK